MTWYGTARTGRRRGCRSDAGSLPWRALMSTRPLPWLPARKHCASEDEVVPLPQLWASDRARCISISRADRADRHTTTPGGRLISPVFGAIGQFERDLIRERTRAGLCSRGARSARRPQAGRHQGGAAPGTGGDRERADGARSAGTARTRQDRPLHTKPTSCGDPKREALSFRWPPAMLWHLTGREGQSIAKSSCYFGCSFGAKQLR